MEKPTRMEIESAQQSRKQLAEWGVSWPPPKGWRKRLLRQADGRYGPISPGRRKGTAALEPGKLHPYWPEWRWDGEVFRKA